MNGCWRSQNANRKFRGCSPNGRKTLAAEADVLHRHDPDADRRDAQREAELDAGVRARDDPHVRAVFEAIERDELLEAVDELEDAEELDVPSSTETLTFLPRSATKVTDLT